MMLGVAFRSGAFALGAFVAACGPSSPATTGGGGEGGETTASTGGGVGLGGMGDPVPDDAQWQALKGLRYVAEPPPDVTNQWADDADAALLGQAFFFDAGFSGPLIDGDNDGSVHALGVKGETGRVACAGCHVPADGFVDTRSLGQQISLAAGWVLRRTPSLLDVGHRKLLNWDGRRDSTWSQALGVIEASREMNSSRLYLAHQIHARYRDAYEAIFGTLPPLDDNARFPSLTADQAGCAELDASPDACHGRPGDGAEYDGMTPADRDAVTRVAVNVGKALGAYLRRLRCGESRFDRWLDGDEAALTAAEKRGALHFVDTGCIDCHGGPLLSDSSFHNVGLMPALVAVVFIDEDDPGASAGVDALLDDPLRCTGPYSDGDDGRLPTSVDPAWLGAFRTPSLRCSAPRPSFMHTGQLRSLDEVVAFFERGGHPAGYLGTSELTDLQLDDQAVADLVAFLGALDGPGPEPALLVAPPGYP
ncbi:MAG: hypothetical protein KC731_15430 [Myxococcales bacterium]|nr:hypothetical protein [Myxococcales bacterium]